jgi:hypothetical protein
MAPELQTKKLVRAEQAQQLVARAHKRQIEDYGPEQWQKDFVFLRDLENRPGWPREKLQAYVWSALPHSKFKRIQELFADSEHLVVPRFELDETGKVNFVKAAVQGLSVRGTVLNPDLFSEDLVASLGLTSFTGLQRDPLGRLRVKGFASVIDGLKRTWDCAAILEEGNLRILRVVTPSAKTAADYPNAAPVATRAVGSLLYSWEVQQEAESSSAWPAQRRKLIIAHFLSPYSARRKTFHEALGYQKEILVLSQIITRTQELQALLRQQWKPGIAPATKEELRAAVNSEIGSCIEVLKRCVNEHKVQARDILSRVVGLQDKLCRDNPPVALSRMIAAVRRLQARFHEMYPRGGFNKQDEMMLQRIIAQHEEPIRRIDAVLSLVVKTVLFTRASLPPEQVKTQVAGVLRRLNPAVESLANLTLRPFLAFRRELRRQSAELACALTLENLPAAKDALIKMHVIAKFHAVNAAFEGMKLLMAQNPSISPEELNAFVKNLQQMFTTRQIFPERTVADYVVPFEAVEAGVQRLADGLQHYIQNPTNAQARIGFTKRLKAFLDLYNLEELVKELPSEIS